MADNLSELDPISLGLAVQTPTGTGYCFLNFTFESRCFCSSSNGLWEKFDISVSRCRKRTARSEEWPRHFNVSVCTHYLSSNEYNPAQWPSIGRGNRRWKAALESLFARITVLVVGINQGAWNKGKRLMKVSDLPSTGTTHSIRLILEIFYWQANTFTQLCQKLWELNKFSVSIWRAWDPNLTLNEQPHRRRLSLTEGESDFLALPVFFFGVSSAIADITRLFSEKSIVFLHFPRKFRAGRLGLLSLNFNFRNVIFQPMVFPFVWAK